MSVEKTWGYKLTYKKIVFYRLTLCFTLLFRNTEIIS